MATRISNVKMSINNKELENRTYNMDNIALRNVKQEKDIGVIEMTN